MATELSAKKVEAQGKTIKELTEAFNNKVDSLKSTLTTISNIVDSEDSDLAQALNAAIQTTDAFKEKTKKTYLVLTDKMIKWATTTIEDESAFSANTKKIQNNIDSILSALNDMN